MVIKEVEGITKKYFTSYYKKYETENGKNVIKYYSFKNNIHFASIETNVNWENTIKKQDDRVTLGIVDTYSRSKDFDKIEVDGIYNSSEILTKVFSVKSNTHLPLE
jgi:hypothetical protein